VIRKGLVSSNLTLGAFLTKTFSDWLREATNHAWDDMMPTELAAQIYREALDFLDGKGLISHLNKLLIEESIDDRMTRIDVTSCGLETVDAVHCLLDKNRTFAFLDAIEKSVKPGEVVVEAGMGTGILAIMAAALGAEVYGIEINKYTLELARQLSQVFIKNGLFDQKNLLLIEADASTWNPTKQIDLIISENIYAGMFYEMQIPIVNHLISYLNSSGRVIPDGMSSYVILTQVDKPLFKGHGESFSPSQAEGRIYKLQELSKPVMYDNINFNMKNDLDCKVDVNIPIIRPGSVNSLLVYSPVKVEKDIILKREDMIFMGEDIFIIIDPPLHVEPQSIVRLRMVYRKGCKPEDGSYFVDYMGDELWSRLEM
jgi:predicted RNA methylase